MSLEVLIITGACGVGKTATAKAWAKKKNGAIIECDYLTEWIYNENFPHWTPEEEAFTVELSGLMAFEYLKRGMSLAIENVWTPKGIEDLRKELFRMNGITVKTVWLKCDLEENHRRDEERIPEDQMKERVDIVNKELEGYTWPSYVHSIDTTKLSIEEVVEEIDKL